ncbi:MAG: 50S ribosomal protein L19 [Candidatus Omnitrophica bacterium]|nr:50S ribosomal protein L19 [Candidatus Omnitrophota bacterium]MDD5351882.1 50S ribosomal protein L19 [Candidatus Omnitrophota bacterium]MDD5550708.1 50S ribosomal protein L19 [Candidatus Omnitrophota bacterium]
MDRIKLLDEQSLRKDLPKFNVGDQIRVFVKIMEGDKARVHPFEGTVIRKRGQGMGASFAVRKVSFGEGVERVFPFNTPSIEKIEVVKKGKVHRAKLYYLRGKIGKVSKVEEDISKPATPPKNP